MDLEELTRYDALTSGWCTFIRSPSDKFGDERPRWASLNTNLQRPSIECGQGDEPNSQQKVETELQRLTAHAHHGKRPGELSYPGSGDFFSGLDFVAAGDPLGFNDKNRCPGGGTYFTPLRPVSYKAGLPDGRTSQESMDSFFKKMSQQLQDFILAHIRESYTPNRIIYLNNLQPETDRLQRLGVISYQWKELRKDNLQDEKERRAYGQMADYQLEKKWRLKVRGSGRISRFFQGGEQHIKKKLRSSIEKGLSVTIIKFSAIHEPALQEYAHQEAEQQAQQIADNIGYMPFFGFKTAYSSGLGSPAYLTQREIVVTNRGEGGHQYYVASRDFLVALQNAWKSMDLNDREKHNLLVNTMKRSPLHRPESALEIFSSRGEQMFTDAAERFYSYLL